MIERPLGIGIIGCGYVADFYGATLPNHPQLNLVSAFDVDAQRMASFCVRYGAEEATGVGAMLADPRVVIVVNLTPPHAHDVINQRVVAAGKHLYSEKPLGLSSERVTCLLDQAERNRVLIAGAPCSVLGGSAQTLAKAVRDGVIGSPRLVYAELDNGALPYLGSEQWTSPRGIPWPTASEVATGCTLEHASYYVTWLVALFGRVRHVHAGAFTLLRDQWPENLVVAPDFTVGVLTLESGVICRITCGWVAPPDLSLTVVGTEGTLRVDDAWSYRAPVTFRRRQQPTGKQHDYLAPPVVIPTVDSGWPDTSGSYKDSHDMDLSRGIAQLADTVTGVGALTLDALDHAHVTDVCLMLSSGISGSAPSRPSAKVRPEWKVSSE